MDKQLFPQNSVSISTIKLADILDNLSSIVEDDPKFAKKYMTEKNDFLSVLRNGDTKLYTKVKEVIDKYFK